MTSNRQIPRNLDPDKTHSFNVIRSIDAYDKIRMALGREIKPEEVRGMSETVYEYWKTRMELKAKEDDSESIIRPEEFDLTVDNEPAGKIRLHDNYHMIGIKFSF